LATTIHAARHVEKIVARSKSIDTLATIFLTAWVTVLLQGALRKWVFPGATIVYLVQDVPLAIAYAYALRKNILWTGRLAGLCACITALLFVQAMLQIIFIDHNPLVAMIGLHHYIFYLPMLFFIPPCMTPHNVRRFLRLNLWINIPMGLLATLQAVSPRGAWVNRTVAGDDMAFQVGGSDAVRAMGTFSFTLMFSIWCGIAVALVIGEWLLPPSRRAYQSRSLLLASTASAAVATMVSGSRTAVFLAAAAFVGAIAAVIVTRNYAHLLRFGAILILLPMLGLLSYLLAPKSFDANLQRFTDPGNQGEMRQRALNMTVGFLAEPKFSTLGMGIGIGIQAASVGSANAYSVSLSEYDSTRIVEELGTFTGVFLVLLRYFAGFVLISAGFKALLLPHPYSFPQAVPLAFTVTPTLMIGDIVRTAPGIATQAYFCIALICGAILTSRQPQRGTTL
jgi:hypothetical protein